MRYHLLPLQSVSNIWTLPFFFRPGVVTSVQLWFCGWDKKQIHATLIDLTSPCPPLESWISCLRREISPWVYFLWTWFHENVRRRYCPLLLPGSYSCSLTQYTQKLPKMKSCPGYCHLQMRGLPPSFCTWKNVSPLFSFLLLLLLSGRKYPSATVNLLMPVCGGDLQSVVRLTPHQSCMPDVCLFI